MIDNFCDCTTPGIIYSEKVFFLTSFLFSSSTKKKIFKRHGHEDRKLEELFEFIWILLFLSRIPPLLENFD